MTTVKFMKDISSKSNTLRIATAKSVVLTNPDTIEKIRIGDVRGQDPFLIARIAAIQAVKNTSLMLPFTHQVPVDHVNIEFELTDSAVEIRAEVKAVYKVGVGMEAMVAATAAALNLYSTVRCIDRKASIGETRILKEKGGQASFREVFPRKLRAGVLVMSDSIASGQKSDLSGKIIVERLEHEGIEVVEYKVIPDDIQMIQETVTGWCDDKTFDLVMTTGGTGITPRDRTPEALMELLERELPGIAEAMRAYGQDRTHYSMLSRSFAGVRGQTLIICFPGSKKGVAESLDAVFPAVLHAFKMIWGGTYARHEHEEDE
ncbi:bifunctional molybdenum cofactor biosynthesis protein MoaC/MoaB [bacterium]|nr:MAG: bifunctional molybdenum cofactor biosynthesis protein MoaC/MoaB [bacterium]